MNQKEIKRLISTIRKSEKILRKALMGFHENGTPAYWRRRQGDKEGTIELITINPKIEGCTRAFLP